MSITIDRLGSLIQKELAIIVNKIIQDEIIGYINLTETKVSNDLSFAKVYYTILKDDTETLKYCEKILIEKKALIRMELAKKIKNIRKIPEIIFHYDNALAYGNHIDKILKTIK